jgi:arylsulfatase A-like enzyme
MGRLAFTPLLQDVLATYLPGIIPNEPLDTTRTITRHARNYFRWQAGTPFLLYVHYMDPHDPYAPPARFTTPPEGSPPQPWPYFAPAPARDWGTPQLSETRQIDLNADEQAWAKAYYASEVRYLDAAIGVLLDSLEKNGLRDSTTVVLMSDHGEELWDRGGYYHGHTLFAEQTRVPLIISGPAIATRVVEEPVSLLDLRPTLAAITQTPTDDHWPGDDLFDDASGAPAFSYGTVLQPWVPADYSVIHEGFKLVVHRDGSHALYEYPGPETEDLQATYPDIAHRLRAQADSIRNAMPAYTTTEKDEGSARERLEALGYL